METVFWKRLTAICAAKHSTPTEEVKAAGLASGNVTYWKNGRMPNTKVIARLADYFGVDPNYFVGAEEIKKQPPEYEGLSATAIEIAKLADRLPPEYLRIARAQLEALEQSIRAQASDE